MSFNKVYEILCDSCGALLVHAYSIAECRRQIKDSNWISGGAVHYCSQECRTLYLKEVKS